MILLLSIAVSILMAGCVAITVQSPPNERFDAAVAELASKGELEGRLNVALNVGGGDLRPLCLEPLMTALTLGVIPRRCTDRYTASLRYSAGDDGDVLRREYQTTFLAGWLALFSLLSPEWRYATREDLQAIIEQRIVEEAR